MPCRTTRTCRLYLSLTAPVELALEVCEATGGSLNPDGCGLVLVLTDVKVLELSVCSGDLADASIPGSDPDYEYQGVDSCHFGLGCYPLGGLI